MIFIAAFLFTSIFFYRKLKEDKENLLSTNQRYNFLPGFWEFDLKTKLLYCSDDVYNIYKIPIGTKITEKDHLSFYPEKERIKLINLINKCINEKESFDDTFEFTDVTGKRKWVRSTGKAILDPKKNTAIKLIGSVQEVTDRIEKEKSLTFSKNKYKQLFIQSQDAIMTLSPPNWFFTSCNPATLKMFNIKSEETFIKMGPWDVSPEKQPSGELSSALAEQAIIKALNCGFNEFEWVHQDMNGKKIPCKVLLSRVQEEDNVYLQATIRDVSKEKELLKQISESKEYYSLAVEGANLGIWDWDLRDNAVAFDKKWAEMLGYDISEIKMELSTWESKVHPDDIQLCYADIKKYLDNKSTYYENIHRMKHKNGNWIYILDRGQISKYDENKNPIRFTGTHLDVTELMINKQKLDLFFKKSPYGFAFCNMEGKFLDINSEFERITGYTKDELNNLSYWDLTPEKYKDDEEKQLNSLNNKKYYGPYRKEYKRKNNELIPVKLNGFIVEDYDGTKGIWSIIEDISAKVKLEEELDNQKKIAFHNSKLASIGELAAGVGHEINNPLAIIRGQLEIITLMGEEHRIDFKELNSRIEKAFNGVDRISHIVKGLRTFARSDDNSLIDFNLSELISETKDLIYEIFSKDDINMIFSIEDGLFVKGNRGKVQQVLINILNNAKDAMKHSSKKIIELNAKIIENKIEIRISDTGTGIPSHIKDKIFQPFFTTKAINEGTGIGLALVDSIIKEHEGSISIDDFYNNGTCFVISLNAVINPTIKKENKQEKVLEEKLESKILVVDDEPDLREILSQLLKNKGFNVVEKANGAEALDYIKNNYKNIDVIISDFKMPLLNGIELAKAVKKIDGYKGKFICVSGGVDTDLGKENFVDAVLMKPYVIDEIVKVIKHLK